MRRPRSPHAALLTGTMLAALTAQAADDDAALRAARAQIIGPVIATGTDYTAHSLQAVAAGGGFRCESGGGARLSDAEYTARINAIQGQARAESDAIMKEKTALMNARRVQPPMPYEEYLAKLNVLNERESASALKAAEAQKKLDEEARGARTEASGHLAITLQHAPRDPGASIVPFEGQYPSASFIADLNRALRPFLASCGNREGVSVSHVYRDHFPAGVDVERRYEKPILWYEYTLRNGTLSVGQRLPVNGWIASNGPGKDPRLTLAGAQAATGAARRESERASATYRQGFADAANRKPGIVYRLDPYWAQYQGDPALDSVRRVFDGDFAGQKDSTAFKAAFFMFGEAWSRRCAAEVPTFTRFRVATSEITRTRTYMDGHSEHDYETQITEIPIDSRFAPQWGDYRPAAAQHLVLAIAGITRDMGSFSTATTEQFAEAMRKTGKISMIGAFFRNHACGSATVAQLRENLVRAANGRPAVQQDGVVLSGAERESDPPGQAARATRSR